MKEFLKVFLIILGIVTLLAVTWFALILYFYVWPRNYVPVPVYSSDGSKVMIPSVSYNKADVGYLEVHIEIQEVRSGKTLYQVQTHASDRMKWSVDWVDANTIRLKSSDIGTYCWREADGILAEAECPASTP
jgi:hypothetical protein